MEKDVADANIVFRLSAATASRKSSAVFTGLEVNSFELTSPTCKPAACSGLSGEARDLNSTLLEFASVVPSEVEEGIGLIRGADA